MKNQYYNQSKWFQVSLLYTGFVTDDNGDVLVHHSGKNLTL